jgi:hypothetical protein
VCWIVVINLNAALGLLGLQQAGRSANFEDTMYALRDEFKNDTTRLVEIVQSHFAVGAKNKLALLLMGALCGKDASQLSNDDKQLFDALASLTAKETSAVSVRARQV